MSVGVGKRGVVATVILLVSMSIVLGLSGSSSAYPVPIEPNSFHIETVPGIWNLEPVERVSFTWTSSLPLRLSVSGPSGLIKIYDAATSRSDILRTDEGVLYFTWVNPNSVNASLEFDYHTETVSERMALSMFFVLVALALLFIGGVAVAVLLVVRSLNRGPSGPFPAGQVPPPPPGASQGASGVRMENCPGCGSKVDPSTRICPGCGARVL